MEYVLLRDYGPFKKGQVIRLGEKTAVKLTSSGIVKPYASKPLVRIPPKPRPELIDFQTEKEEPRIKKKKKGKINI